MRDYGQQSTVYHYEKQDVTTMVTTTLIIFLGMVEGQELDLQTMEASLQGLASEPQFVRDRENCETSYSNELYKLSVGL